MRSRTRRAPSACPKGHVRDLGIGQWAPHPTRLETRTKESDMRASQRVRKPEGTRKLTGGNPLEGLHRRPTPIFCEGFELEHACRDPERW
ncbi:hypothetical protein OPV22_034733 [Ensete ventricosum]|uniref:Uncharacterized protein n=1 Tax=Ensete ventricosum TaxID=4639 RepID=A0AAV8PT57_ENSVE|nr:hypothetical protein OPV22_034733 [Ensete ventricosum]